MDLWREIADAHELKNDYTQAIAAYKKYYDSLAQDKKTSENLFQLGRLYYGEGTSSDTLSVQSADRMAALQAADSVFALVAEQAPDSYLGDMWRAAHTLPWTPKLQRDWRNLITRRWWTYCLPKTNRGTTLH